MAGIPHFALPFRFQTHLGQARAVVNEQDSYEEIADCVQAVLSYERGTRVELPEFGIRDQTFRQGGVDKEEIERVISQWEPRADAVIESDPVELENYIARAQINVEVPGA